MKLYRLVLLVIFLFSYVEAITYEYKNNFEKEEQNPLKCWVTDLDLSKDVNVSYSYDRKLFTEGKSSLKIDLDIKGKKDKSKNWYYYLEVPLGTRLSITDSLSLAMDIKTNKNIEIGFYLQYLPLWNSIHILPQKFKKNKWTKVKINNFEKFTLGHAQNFISKIYAADVNDFGRSISKILILLKGRGAQKYQINLDNLNIVGEIKDNSSFKKTYQKSWVKHINKRDKNIENKRIKYRNSLKKLKKIKVFKSKNYYKKKIDALFKEIDLTLGKHEILKTSVVEHLDSYLRKIDTLANNSSSINIYKMPTMKYFRLKGNNTPPLSLLSSYNLRMTAGEYKSIALLLDPVSSSGTFMAENTSFIGNTSSFPKDSLDLYIGKLWYQSGLNNTLKTGKFLTQELLLKDDTLVKVDYKTQTNYLRVKYNDNSLEKYIKISSASDKFPNVSTIKFNDSKHLKPFKLDAIRHKLLWGIIHIPKNTKAGNYTSILKIKDIRGKVIKEFPINIEVLPFELDKSKLVYSLYYTGKLTKYKVFSLDSYRKTKKQQEIELRDIKEHGVLYPTSYETIQSLEDTLEIRNRVGLPTDRFYTIGFNIMSNYLLKNINKYQDILKDNGYTKDALYVYAIDEASEEKLKDEISDIENVHKYGAKVFVAGYDFTHDSIGDYLDVFNYSGGVNKVDYKEQVFKWHKSKKEIFSYATPQVGVENPEIYRRNFGCKLWQRGFDGAMNWAYQAHRGAFWNDFDEFDKKSKYREEVFTYPTTDGLIGTIQWEGYREAITDVRYISTLENLRDKLHNRGENMSKLDSWIGNIDCSLDLDQLREDIIDKILIYRSQYFEQNK